MPTQEPDVLFDTRLGGPLTGIGRYKEELTRQFAVLAPDRVRPLCWRSQAAGLRALGLKPCVDIRGRSTRSWALPHVDVTHGPNFTPIGRRGAAAVITAHDVAWKRFPDFYPPATIAELEGCLTRAAQQHVFAICDSDSARNDLINFYGYAPERTQTIHLGVDPRYGEATPNDTTIATSYGLERYLLHVGAWVPRKDVPTLLAAWSLIAEDEPDLDLALVGDTGEGWKSDRPRVDEWIAANPRLAGRLKILGHISEQDLPAVTRRAAVLVSASRWEGFGLAPLQAMMAGVPVAAAENSSLPEVGRDHMHFGRTGDAESLASAIVAALASTPERRRSGVERARALSWQRCAEQTLACYARV